jgi:hypothetical protein
MDPRGGQVLVHTVSASRAMVRARPVISSPSKQGTI